jgi:hypothetical protein
MNGVWEVSTARCTHGSHYRLGRIIVASTSRAIGNKSEPDAPLWQAVLHLPGVRASINAERFHTEAEAKRIAEARVNLWFELVKQ